MSSSKSRFLNTSIFCAILGVFYFSHSAFAVLGIPAGSGGRPANIPKAPEIIGVAPSAPTLTADEKAIAACYAQGGQCSNKWCLKYEVIEKSCCSGGAQSGGDCSKSDNSPDKPVSPPVGGGPATPAPPGTKPKPPPTAERPPAGGDDGASDDPGGGGQQPPGGGGNQASCQSAAQKAFSTCRSAGGSGGFSSSSGGINSSASQLQAGTAGAARGNLSAAIACSSAYNSCVGQCQQVNPSLASQCQSLESVTRDLGKQTQSLDEDNQGAKQAGDGSSPGGGPPGQDGNLDSFPNAQNDPTGCTTDPTGPQCQLCTQDPSHPSCGGGGQSPRAQYRENESTRRTLDEFNTPDPGGYVPQAGYGGDPSAYQAPQVRPVPNGGGGGMGGDSGSGARLDQQRGGRAQPNSNVADILQGEGSRSGWSGYGNGRPTNEFENGGGRFGTQSQRGPASAGRTPYDGMDLKRYLPTRGMDPGRNTGGMDSTNQEITSKFGLGNFQKMSNRFRARCARGKLDCP